MKLRILIATAILLPFSFLLSACNQNETAALVTVLGNDSASIATLEGNTALAAKLKADTATASQEILNWKQGTASQNVVEALNLVEDDLNLFPVTNAYAPLIDLAIGTAESIIQIIAPNNVPTAEIATAHGVTVRRVVVLKNPAPKKASDFTKQWNQLAAQYPELSQAKLK